MAALKQFLFKSVIRSTVLAQGSPLTQRLPVRCLSTEGEARKDASEDPFLRAAEEGLVFAKLTGASWNTLKTDVINFFEGCNLSVDDIKIMASELGIHNIKNHRASGFKGELARTTRSIVQSENRLLQCSSRSAFDTAVRQNARKGRLYKLEKVDRSHWDLTTTYDGKAVLLQGLPRNGVQEDIERFLSGCNFDPSTFQILLRPGIPDPVRLALVRFNTRLDAMNAFYRKNRGFCLNNPITVRVLQ